MFSHFAQWQWKESEAILCSDAYLTGSPPKQSYAVALESELNSSPLAYVTLTRIGGREGEGALSRTGERSVYIKDRERDREREEVI